MDCISLDEINEFYARFMKAWNDKDPDALISFYEINAQLVQISPGMELRIPGRRLIEALLRVECAEPRTMGILTAGVIESILQQNPRGGCPCTSVLYNNYMMLGTPPRRFVVDKTFVLEKRDGKLQILYQKDHLPTAQKTGLLN